MKFLIIDEVDEEGAIGRSMADAPEIDGAVYLNGETNVKPGDILRVKSGTPMSTICGVAGLIWVRPGKIICPACE